MADSPAERTRRSRAHRAGDHRDCSPSRCPDAGTVEAGAGPAGLHRAIEAEFRGDPVRLQTGRALVELASGKGAPAVSALVAIDRMLEAQRRGRSAPPVYTGPITVDDEIRELIDKLSRCGCPCHEAGHDREVCG